MGLASPGCQGTQPRRRHGTPVTLMIVALTLVFSQGWITPAKGQGAVDAVLPRAPPLLTSSEVAEPTPAWIEFCQRLPDECAIETAEPEVIGLTPDLWRTLASVNEQVNAAIKPLSDQEHWGVVDRWDYPDDGYGDCEDIQLLKRKRLIEAGLPRRALRMTVVLDEVRAGHAVLMVRTDRGDFILDNQRRAVLAWTDTGYEFIKREGAEGRAWVTLSPHPAPVVTANQ